MVEGQQVANEPNPGAPPSAETPVVPPASGVTESRDAIRERLVAKAKSRTAAKEAAAKVETEGAAKPAAEASKEAPPEADKAKTEELTPEAERAALKKERREFAKAKRKWESETESLKAQLDAGQNNFRELADAFKKDPIEWLKKQGISVKDTLIRLANEDSETPESKKARELEERLERQEAKDAERDAAEAVTKEAEAVKHITGEMLKEWNELADPDAYPTLVALLEPGQIAERACKHAVNHFKISKKILAPSEVFDILEADLAPFKGKVATKAKAAEPPEPVRSVGKAKPESPEAPRVRERPSEDVTSRTTRIQTVGRAGFDKEAVREKLVGMARERMRRT